MLRSVKFCFESFDEIISNLNSKIISLSLTKIEFFGPNYLTQNYSVTIEQVNKMNIFTN